MKAMQIKTLLLEITHSGGIIEHGYGNGYIGVPEGHPWFGKHYDDIPCEVHGGLTYSDHHAPRQEPDGYWWIGFDTGHWGDNKQNCDKKFCENEIESMKDQASLAT